VPPHLPATNYIRSGAAPSKKARVWSQVDRHCHWDDRRIPGDVEKLPHLCEDSARGRHRWTFSRALVDRFLGSSGSLYV